MAGIFLSPGGCCGCNPPTPCTLCVSLSSCSFSHPVGAGGTVTVTGPGGFTGTCTTTSGSSCCIDVTAGGSGSYTVSGSKSGWIITPRTLTVTCPGTTNTSLSSRPVTYPVVFSVTGCNGAALPGATVTAGSATGTTDSSGNVTLNLPDGTINYTVTYPPRFQTATGSFTINCTFGLTVPVAMTPASGYVCCTFGGAYSGPIPVARTLTGSDSGGAVSIYMGPSDSSFHGGHDISVDNASVTWFAEICPGGICSDYTPPADMANRTAGVAYDLALCGTISGQVLRPGKNSAFYHSCATCSPIPSYSTAWGSTDSYSLFPSGGRWGSPLGWPVSSVVVNSPPPALSITVNFVSDVWTRSPGGTAAGGVPPSTSVTFTE